jgi:hypothetical protein
MRMPQTISLLDVWSAEWLNQCDSNHVTIYYHNFSFN